MGYEPGDLYGNDFAKGVKRSGGAPEPDDDKARSPIMYVLFGLLSLVLVAVFVAALVLPPLFMHTLIVRGIRSGRPAMLAAGLVLAALYILIMFSVGKKLMGRPKPPSGG
jgi:hypothetical protein